MFRLFLRKKILSGRDETQGNETFDDPSSLGPNKRLFSRFNVDYKHLTLMNEQDILLVRDISLKGFCTELSDRGFSRMHIGDSYDARMRYFGEIYDLKAKVAWKKAPFVGFQVVEAPEDTIRFLRRLLKPMEIANSLSLVQTSFTSAAANGKTWYRGDDETDLYIWHDPNQHILQAWHLAFGDSYVEWNESEGITTGSLVRHSNRTPTLRDYFQSSIQERDAHVDTEKQRFAADVIMALRFEECGELLETIKSRG